MLLIYASLYPEVKEVIGHYDLKKVKESSGIFLQFSNEEILLTITGTGPIKAACAVGSVLTQITSAQYVTFNDSAKKDNGYMCHDMCIDNVLLLGSASSIKRPEGMEIYLANKVVNMDSGRTFYPDMILKSKLPEATVITGSRILDVTGKHEKMNGESKEHEAPDCSGCCVKMTGVSRETNETDAGICNEDLAGKNAVLYDMESAAVYEAAALKLGPDKIHILKLVSDNMAGSTVSRENLENCFKKNRDSIFEYIDILLEDGRQSDDDAVKREAEILAEDLADKGKFSVTMKNEASLIIRYGLLQGLPIKKKISELEEIGRLPAKDRRAGKEILDEIRKYV